MKKLIIIFVAFATFLCVGCDFGSKKLVVKANPKYEFSIGTVNVPFDFDIVQMIKENVGNQIDAVYDYNPGGKCWEQKVLFEKDIQKIDFDISSYFSEDSLSDGLERKQINQEIKIPSVNFKEEINLELDVLNDSISKLVQIPVAIPIRTNPIPFTFKADSNSDGSQGAITDGFSSIKYKSGYFVVTLIDTNTGLSSSVFDGQQIQLTCNGAIISEAVVGNGLAKFDMSNKSIDSTNTYLNFTMVAPDVSFTGKMEEGIVEEVQGLSLAKTIININKTIETQEQFSKFDDCIIDNGYVYINLSVSSSWNGMTFSYPITFSGAIEGTTETINGASGVFERKTLNEIGHGNIVAKSDVVVSFTNGCLNLNDIPKLFIWSEINKVKEAKVVIDGIEPQKISYPIPAEVLKNLKSMELEDSVFPIPYECTLPSGNDIGIKLVSKFLNIESKKTMKNGREVLNFSSTGHIISFDDYENIDLVAEISLQGSTPDNPNQVFVQDVELGKTYDIEIDIKPGELFSEHLKWKRVEVSLADLGRKDSMDTGIDVKSIVTNALKESNLNFNITPNLTEVGVYLYISQPDLASFRDVAINGDVKLYTSENNYIYLSKKSDSRKIVFKPIPELTVENDVLKSELLQIDCSAYADIKDVLNNSEENETLNIDFDLSFESDGGTSSVWISREDIDNSNELSIEVAAFIDLPVQFEFDDDLELDVMSLIFKDSSDSKDLLGRTHSGDEDFDYLANIEYGALNYTIRKLPINVDGKLKIKMPNNSDQIGNMKSGRIEIQNIDKVLNTYPLMPTISLVIPKEINGNKNVISLKRDSDIDIDVTLELSVDADYVVYGGQ